MSDTAPRTAASAARMLADALLRSAGGAAALLRVTGQTTTSSRAELGLMATTFADVAVSPVAMRKLRPSWKEGDQPQWELLVSATGVEQQVSTLSLASARALFDQTLAVTVAGQDYLIESVASNEVFGQVYVYRLLLHEARQQAV